MSTLDHQSNDLLQVLGLLAKVLGERETEYALVGGLGVAMRGPIRTTRDVDLLLSVPQLEFPGLLESLKELGFQVEVVEAITAWNRDHLLSFTFGRVRIDWLKAIVPPFQHVLNRAKWETVQNQPVRVADAEGLLLLKLIAFRPSDKDDIRGILTANPGVLDLDWVRREWAELADSDDARASQFERMIGEHYIS